VNTLHKDKSFSVVHHIVQEYRTGTLDSVPQSLPEQSASKRLAQQVKTTCVRALQHTPPTTTTTTTCSPPPSGMKESLYLGTVVGCCVFKSWTLRCAAESHLKRVLVMGRIRRNLRKVSSTFELYISFKASCHSASYAAI
jgi:hypothetical protein